MTAHRPMHPGGRLVLAYFVLAFAWTWGWWGYAAASRREWTEWPALVAFLLGGLGPLLAAFTVIRLGRGRTEQRQFWSRVFLPRRVPGRWWLAILAVAVGGRSLALLIASACGLDAGEPAELPPIGALAGIAAFDLAAGFAEEPGWRGVAHDGARARFGIGVTGLVVGTGWALWHIPLYFVDGTFHHGLGFANSGFWLVSTTLLPLSVLYAWVVDQTRGSILAAVLIHAGANMTSELLPVSAAVRAVELALLAVAALAIVVWTSRPRPR